MWLATQARESYPYYHHETIGYNYRMSNICAGIGRGQMTVLEDHIAHHHHVQALYEQLLADVPGITVHTQPNAVCHLDQAQRVERSLDSARDDKGGTRDDIPVYDSNYWLTTITLDPALKVKGQENAYKQMVTSAVGGAAGVIHTASTAVTDCQPNDNVEALRLALLAAGVESRPLWKPMHKQPVYREAPAYVNGVSEGLFKVGMCLPTGPCVTDENVKHIVNTIKASLL